MAKRVEPIDRWTGERQRSFDEQIAAIQEGLDDEYDDDDDYFDDEEPYDEDAGLEDT